MKKLFFTTLIVLLATACQQKQTRGVVLNEICGEDADGLEWVEVANGTDQAVNLRGYKLMKMDGDGVDKVLYKFPDTLLAAGAIFTVNAEFLKAHIPNKKPAVIELLDAEGNVADAFDSEQDLELEGHAKGESYARVPNITGGWTLCKAATWDAPNDGKPAETAPAVADKDDFDLDEDED